ncbi:1781_t:CDS:2, partial [Ambispora leptoticha]
TTSIRAHLQQKHNLLLKGSLTVLSKKHSPKIQAEKTQAILNWIILTLKPFKVIEEKAFHNMVQKLDPFYQIPVLALTADFWTSLKMENFIAITIHFIDNNWKLQHFVLDIFQFKGSHTGEIIADKIYNLLEVFNIETKVIGLTTDNAHILNLVVVSGLKLLETPIKKLRKLIKTICKSAKILEDLENIATIM